MPSIALSNLKRYPLVLYFVLTYLISWAIMIPVALSAQGVVSWHVPYSLYYFASFGPMSSALIVTALTEGGRGVRLLLGRPLKWRGDIGYYEFAVLAPIGLFGLAVLVNYIVTERKNKSRKQFTTQKWIWVICPTASR